MLLSCHQLQIKLFQHVETLLTGSRDLKKLIVTMETNFYYDYTLSEEAQCTIYFTAMIRHVNLHEEALRNLISPPAPSQVRGEVDALPADERLAIVLVCIAGFSYQEAALQLSVPVDEIRNRLLRGRSTLIRKMHLWRALDGFGTPCGLQKQKQRHPPA
jgi:RNA polymerase sigma-70 factor (ECF subfamily)